MNNDPQHYYDRAVHILDNFLTESLEIYKQTSIPSDWKHIAIWKALKQANHILFCLLSNTEGSKFLNEKYVLDTVIVGNP
jgi:hypothetical protein